MNSLLPPYNISGATMVKLNPDRIEKKSYTLEKKNPKHTQIWEWEEGPELREFIKKQSLQ